MSAFDETQKAAEITRSSFRAGFQAALDHMEGLVGEWDKEAADMRNRGVKQGHRICGDKLIARIAELREQS